jgi:hypothetical protein
MMISDEDLLLYHYGDGLRADEREAIAKALTADATLAARLKQLVTELDAAIPATAPVPVTTQQRWRTALGKAANARVPQSTSPTRKSFWKINTAFALAVAMSIAVGAVGIAFWQKHDGSDTNSSPVMTASVPLGGNADNARFERSLNWYLSDTEQQLSNLKQLRVDERTPVLERVLVQNRMYALAADRADEPRYARALRSFAPVIESISGDDTDASELEAGVAQLKFELKVMQARLSTTSSASKRAALATPI